jgi:adenylate cyclase
MMPGRDGWEMLQRLRAQPSTRDTPIMICTVFQDAQLAYSLGASAFVSKPANRETILGTLGDLGIL